MNTEENKPISFAEEMEKRFHEAIVGDREEWLKSTHSYYVNLEEGSQFYDDLNQLLNTMKYLKMNKKVLESRPLGKSSVGMLTIEQEIEYIIKGLENTISRGYKITLEKPAPTGVIVETSKPNVNAWVDHKDIGVYKIHLETTDGSYISDNVPISVQIMPQIVTQEELKQLHPEEFKPIRSRNEIERRLFELYEANNNPKNPFYGVLLNHIRELEWVLNKKQLYGKYGQQHKSNSETGFLYTKGGGNVFKLQEE